VRVRPTRVALPPSDFTKVAAVVGAGVGSWPKTRMVGAPTLRRCRPPRTVATSCCAVRTATQRRFGDCAVETAYRALKAAGAVFRHGVQNGLCESDPTRDLQGAVVMPESKHRAAVTDPAKLGQLLRAIESYQGTPVVRAALTLAPMVFLRPNEFRRAEWSEIDLESATWTIPSVRMKGRLKAKLSGVPHIVPLAPQAVAVLRQLQPLTGKGRYVFPNPLTAERPMSENAILTALRRMGFAKEEVTGHGFRATARTILAERLDVAAELVEAQLAHAVSDSLGRAYNRARLLEQRRQMMTTWANYLDKLRTGFQAAPIAPPALVRMFTHAEELARNKDEPESK